MAERLSVLFEEEPKQWGLRADEFLWNDMKKYFSNIEFPYSEKDFLQTIINLEVKYVGKELNLEDKVYVENYAHGGMSSGYISGEFWNNRGIPLLVKRYREITDKHTHHCKDKKRDYLIKTFSRTKRKDYENYIVNGIWHRLKRLDIQPVTQQFVLRSDGKRALIDLYFPALNYGVECDEAYHINNKELDTEREIRMEEMLATVSETDDFILRRVPAYESIDIINKCINDIVFEIQQLFVERKIQHWNTDEESYQIVLQKGRLAVADNLNFEKIVDICRCFGKDYKGMQRAYFNIDSGYSVWCPKLAQKTSEGLTAVSNGWINTLSDDWNYITESQEKQENFIHATKDEPLRVTFAKSKDILAKNVYKFIGVFQYIPEKSTERLNVYKRVAKVLEVNKWIRI